MYLTSFPDGTIYAIKLPPEIYAKLMTRVSADGTVDYVMESIHGNYMDFCGYKVKITKYEVMPGKPQTSVSEEIPPTFKVRLV